MENERFFYAIGFYWNEDWSNRDKPKEARWSAYAYGSDLHYGTMESAQNLLDYVVRSNKDLSRHGPYSIFKFTMEEIKAPLKDET